MIKGRRTEIHWEISLHKAIQFGKRSGNLKAVVPKFLLHFFPNSQAYAMTDKDKSNVIVVNFESQFKGNPIANINIETEINESVWQFLRTEIEPLTFRMVLIDVYKEIKNLKIKKSLASVVSLMKVFRTFPLVIFQKSPF